MSVDSSTLNGMFRSIQKFANVTATNAKAVGSAVGDTTYAVVDTLGIKSGIEAADKAARRVINDGGRKLADANKAMNKARRLAKKKIVDVLEIDEDGDDMLASSDYELLLSAAGALERNIGISTFFSQSFTVPAGSAFVWKARVKRHDIGFIVRELRDSASPSEAIDIESLTRYRSDAPIQGHLPAVTYSRTITLVFDNVHSHLQTKKVVYWVACGENVTLADDAVGAARSLEVSAAEEGPQE